MPRSTAKGPYVPHYLSKKIAQATAQKSPKPIETYARNALITPDFVGLNFKIHNGKKFIPFLATEDTVGHKLGEFAPTRKPPVHTQKNKKK